MASPLQEISAADAYVTGVLAETLSSQGNSAARLCAQRLLVHANQLADPPSPTWALGVFKGVYQFALSQGDFALRVQVMDSQSNAYQRAGAWASAAEVYGPLTMSIEPSRRDMGYRRLMAIARAAKSSSHLGAATVMADLGSIVLLNENREDDGLRKVSPELLTDIAQSLHLALRNAPKFTAGGLDQKEYRLANFVFGKLESVVQKWTEWRPSDFRVQTQIG